MEGKENRWNMALVVEEYSLKSLVLHQTVSQVSMFQSKFMDLSIFSFLDCLAMLRREWLL